MKIRNKKTGEVFEAFKKAPIDLYFYLNKYEEGENDFDRKTYQSLAELNSEWEDYNPKEPLIKDEKFRKVVRWWAAANDNMTKVQYDKDEDCIYLPSASDETDTSVSLSFDNVNVFEKLEHRKYYTIAELCGEEEE